MRIGFLIAVVGAVLSVGARTIITFEAQVPAGSDDLERAKKFVAAYKVGHPFAYKIKVAEGESRFVVLSNRKEEPFYAGPNIIDAQEAVVNALTDIPSPGRLVEGITLKHCRALKSNIVDLGISVERSSFVSALNGFLKSKKPAVVEEARAIRDAIAARKKGLEIEIDENLSKTDDIELQGEALRDMRWYVATWPSEKKRYEDKLLELEANTAVKAVADKLRRHALKRK